MKEARLSKEDTGAAAPRSVSTTAAAGVCSGASVAPSPPSLDPQCRAVASGDSLGRSTAAASDPRGDTVDGPLLASSRNSTSALGTPTHLGLQYQGEASPYNMRLRQQAAAAVVDAAAQYRPLPESLVQLVRNTPYVSPPLRSSSHQLTTGTRDGGTAAAAAAALSIGSGDFSSRSSNGSEVTPSPSRNTQSVAATPTLTVCSHKDPSEESDDSTSRCSPLNTDRRRPTAALCPAPVVPHTAAKDSNSRQCTTATATAAAAAGCLSVHDHGINSTASLQSAAKMPCWITSLHDVLAPSPPFTAPAAAAASVKRLATHSLASSGREPRPGLTVSSPQRFLQHALVHILQRERVRVLIARAFFSWHQHRALRLHARHRFDGRKASGMVVQEVPLPTPSLCRGRHGEQSRSATRMKSVLNGSRHTDAAMSPSGMGHSCPLITGSTHSSPLQTQESLVVSGNHSPRCATPMTSVRQPLGGSSQQPWQPPQQFSAPRPQTPPTTTTTAYTGAAADPAECIGVTGGSPATTVGVERSKSVVGQFLHSSTSPRRNVSPHQGSAPLLAGDGGGGGATPCSDGSVAPPHSRSQSEMAMAAAYRHFLLRPYRPRNAAGGGARLNVSDSEDRSSPWRGMPRDCDSTCSDTTTPVPTTLPRTVPQLLACELVHRLAVYASEEHQRTRLQGFISAVVDQLLMAALNHRSDERGLHSSLRGSPSSWSSSPVPGRQGWRRAVAYTTPLTCLFSERTEWSHSPFE